MLERTLTVRVARITRQTDEVAAFELVHPRGGTLPGYAPGSHIDVHLPGGFLRTYSLAEAAGGETCRRYLIGVKREPAATGGRGGSLALHQRVVEGDLLAISSPRCTFALQRDATHHLLLAGGIGLTPLLAMAQQLAREGASFELITFTRSRAHLAFADALAALGTRVRHHFDDAPASRRIALAPLLASPAPGTHLYLCGPAGFMQAARDAAAAWPDEQVHVEYFKPPAGGDEGSADEPFTLRLAGRGIELRVGADQTAIDALHDIGVDVPTSCSQGVCGTCVVRWVAGEPEHRDHCLSATERRRKIALCCSRAKGGMLEVEV